MTDLTDLTRAIEAKLAADDERKRTIKEQLRARHEEREEQLERFAPIAARIAETVIRPRMEQLAGYFDNARLAAPEEGCSHCVCRFETTPRFPASTTLELAVAHDEAIENLIVSYGVQILPVFLEYERGDSLFLPLSDVDEDRLARWLDDKLLQFVDTYLELEQIEQYQKPNLVLDPVCGVRLNKNDAAAASTHAGRTYHFCTADCQAKFVADPAGYLGAAKP